MREKKRGRRNGSGKSKPPKQSRMPRKFVSFHDAAMDDQITLEKLENLRHWHD